MYKDCHNPVVRFCFQLAMPDERNKLLKNEPETDEELMDRIEGIKEYENLLKGYLSMKDYNSENEN